jgi:hypothetical protein
VLPSGEEGEGAAEGGAAEGATGEQLVKAAGPLAVAGNESVMLRQKMLETLAAGKEKPLTFDVFSVRMKR